MVIVHFENGATAPLDTSIKTVFSCLDKIAPDSFNFMKCGGVMVNLKKVTHFEEVEETEGDASLE